MLAARQAESPLRPDASWGALPEFAARNAGRVSRLLNSAAVVTSPSGYLVTAMSRYRPDVVLQPNPIRAASYTFRARSTPAPRLLWVRALHEIYNPSMAVRVVDRLRHDYPDVQLTIVGPDRGDRTREKTMELTRQLGVEAHVEFLGPVAKDRLPEVFDTHDIFLNTSSVDNTPTTVVEALACGLCLVSTSVGGVPYLVEHERDALLVPPDDADAMAVAVRRLLETPSLAHKLSTGGRQNALARDWALLLPRWQHLLAAVSEKRSIFLPDPTTSPT